MLMIAWPHMVTMAHVALVDPLTLKELLAPCICWPPWTARPSWGDHSSLDNNPNLSPLTKIENMTRALAST